MPERIYEILWPGSRLDEFDRVICKNYQNKYKYKYKYKSDQVLTDGVATYE